MARASPEEGGGFSPAKSDVQTSQVNISRVGQAYPDTDNVHVCPSHHCIYLQYFLIPIHRSSMPIPGAGYMLKVLLGRAVNIMLTKTNKIKIQEYI